MVVYSVNEIIRALKNDGWYLVRCRGSHRQYRHASKPGLVTVSGHRMRGDVFGKLLDSIEEQSGLDFSQIYGR